jgi:hypothetical protein
VSRDNYDAAAMALRVGSIWARVPAAVRDNYDAAAMALRARGSSCRSQHTVGDNYDAAAMALRVTPVRRHRHHRRCVTTTMPLPWR